MRAPDLHAAVKDTPLIDNLPAFIFLPHAVSLAKFNRPKNEGSPASPARDDATWLHNAKPQIYNELRFLRMTSVRVRVHLTCLMAGAIVGAQAPGLAAPGERESLDFFEAKIRPVLVEHCYKCHSVESKKRKGEL